MQNNQGRGRGYRLHLRVEDKGYVTIERRLTNLLFLFSSFFCPFVSYCFTSTVSSTPSRSRVISQSRRLRLITLTETLIILDITKTESNNHFIIHWTKQKKSCFCFFTDGKQDTASKLDMITLRNHAPRSYMTWLPATFSVLDMIIV